MRWIYGFLVILLVVVGCGTKHSNPVGSFPTVDQLVADGWDAYHNMNYETAIAKFDSAIDIDATSIVAHLGGGWSRVHLSQFRDSRANFSLAISIEGSAPVRDVTDEDSDVTGTPWLIEPALQPLVGMKSLTVYSEKLESITKSDTFWTEVIYEVSEFTDATILLAWSADNAEELDPAPPVAEDILKVNYTHYVGEDEGRQVDAYCGEAAGYAAEEEDYEEMQLKAIISGNAVLAMDSSYVFDYDDEIDAQKLHIILAQCYYNVKLFKNALWEVLKVDPAWVYDEESATFLYDLLKKIQSLGS